MSAICLILQRRPTKTGAQMSLLRWLKSGAWTALKPHVLVGSTGWLTTALDEAALPWSVHAFPSSRALAARLYGNRRFSAQVLSSVDTPSLILGNDHPEGLLAQSLARQAGCPWAVLLRSHEASARDLRKYACHEAHAVLSVSGADAATTALQRPVQAFPEGLLPSEFRAPKAPEAGLGPRVLVVGTPNPAKGWQDFVAALRIEAPSPNFGPLQWDFTGSIEGLGEPPAGHHFKDVGRAVDYANFVRNYDLVLHPSRGETFGLAVVEAWAAGVPVLSSNTGVVPRLPLPDGYRFEPGDVAELSARLAELRRSAPLSQAQITDVQDALRRHHQWPQALTPVMRGLQDLMSR